MQLLTLASARLVFVVQTNYMQHAGLTWKTKHCMPSLVGDSCGNSIFLLLLRAQDLWK